MSSRPSRAAPCRCPEVPDPVFSGQGMVGYGAVVDPPHQVIYGSRRWAAMILKLLRTLT